MRPHLRALPVALAALAGLAACGARSSPIADDEPTDCAVERQIVFEDCNKKCGVVQSPMRRAGKTWTRTDRLEWNETPPTPCVEECIAGVQRECEATATCRCADSLLTASAR